MITQEEFQRRIDERFPNESFTVIKYNNSLGKEAVVKCNNCGRELVVSKASNFLIYSKRVGCKYCQDSFYKQRNELIEQIKESYDIINIDYFDNDDTHLRYTVQCKKCGHIRTTSLRNLEKNLFCGCETGVLRNRSPEEFIETVNENTHDQYELVGEYKGQINKVLLRHVKCGFIYKVRPADIIQGKSCCPKCRKTDSIGAQYITNILVDNNILFEKEKRLDGLKLRFDFYLENDNHKIAIEYNGIQHYKEVEYFSSTLKEVQDRDERKAQYCLQNNIELYVIPYTDNYDEIYHKLIEIINRFNDYSIRKQS